MRKFYLTNMDIYVKKVKIGYTTGDDFNLRQERGEVWKRLKLFKNSGDIHIKEKNF